MMGFSQCSHVLLNILLAVFSGSKAETLKPCKPVILRSITLAQGDNVSIPCLTFTHHPNSFELNLQRANSDKHILQYPEPSSQFQRWVVRIHAENVTVDLKAVVLTDTGQYECEVHVNSKCTTTKFNLKVKECKVLKTVWTTPMSSVTLQCPEHVYDKWEVVLGDRSTDIVKYLCKHSEITKGALKPLCERQKINHGSLTIRDVVKSDALWYRCRGNETCYDMKLHVKDYDTSHETLSTALTTADAPASPFVLMNDSRNTTAAVVSVALLCVVISLIIVVILYLKKRKTKNTSGITMEYSRNSLYFAQESVYYSQISDGLQFPLYHVMENNSEAMSTFVAEQTEDAGCRYKM